MEINLSWDLFVIVFFTVVIAYSFIIGRNQTAKVVISTYIAILASDGLGNLIERFFVNDNAIILKVSNKEAFLVIMKIVIFIGVIVLITTRGRFTITMNRGAGAMNMIFTLVYGFLSAGLITSTILIYASGASLVQESALIVNDAVLAIYNQSDLVKLMINNYNIWFSLPAITFVISSFVGDEMPPQQLT